MSVRKWTAVCVLCCLGTLVVTSLFASPAERAAYRAAPVETRQQHFGSPGGTGAHGTAPSGKSDPC